MNDETQKIVDLDSPATPLEKIDRSLSDVFGTTPIEVEAREVSPLVNQAEEQPNEQVVTDHNFARSNMYSLMQQGQDALLYAIDLAKQTESPRGFEVVATMMKNLADMNSQLLDLHEKKSRIVKPVVDKPAEAQKTVNNTVVFTGTTAEINKILNDMRKDQ
jgi:hypothetical protein